MVGEQPGPIKNHNVKNLFYTKFVLLYKVFCTFTNFNSGLMVEEEKNAQSNFFES